MNDELALVVSLVITLAVGTGFGTVSVLNAGGDLGQEPPATVDCRYDVTGERVTVEIADGEIGDEWFAGVWVYVDDDPARLSGTAGTTDTGETTDTGAWVIDGDVGDVADFPLDEETTVTVHDTAPTDDVEIVAIYNDGDGGSLIGSVAPTDCPTTRTASRRLG